MSANAERIPVYYDPDRDEFYRLDDGGNVVYLSNIHEAFRQIFDLSKRIEKLEEKSK